MPENFSLLWESQHSFSLIIYINVKPWHCCFYSNIQVMVHSTEPVRNIRNEIFQTFENTGDAVTGHTFDISKSRNASVVSPS